MPLDSNEVKRQLLNKFGFEDLGGGRGDHDACSFFYLGRKIATTHFKRGRRYDIGDTLLKRMAVETRVEDLDFFKMMIECSKSKEDFLRELRRRNYIP